MSSLRRKLRQRKDQALRKFKDVSRGFPTDFGEAEIITKTKKADSDEEDDDEEEGEIKYNYVEEDNIDADSSIDGDEHNDTGPEDRHDNIEKDGQDRPNPDESESQIQPKLTSRHAEQQAKQQEFYKMNLGDVEDAAAGNKPMPTSSKRTLAIEGRPYFHVRRRNRRSRTITGMASGWMKDRSDDLKEWMNRIIIANQYGKISLGDGSAQFKFYFSYGTFFIFIFTIARPTIFDRK